jgi:CMP-N-acetylneuraminic acid synthetase
MVVMPDHLVQDIDTPEDWKRAELLYKLINDENAQ